MALFVVHLGLSPTEYYKLTGYERDALIKAYERANKK